MNIVLMGDSITDMGRNRTEGIDVHSFGNGYAFLIESELSTKYPLQHNVYNRGISGNRVVDLYARMKADCWNLSPDLVTVLIGTNDVWHEIGWKNGVEIDRYERVYRMFLDDTKKANPHVKFMLLEPFVLKGVATAEHYERFLQIREYAKVVKKIAEDMQIVFVPLQDKFDELSEKYGVEHLLFDGVHPTVAGAKLIADAWLEGFAKL